MSVKGFRVADRLNNVEAGRTDALAVSGEVKTIAHDRLVAGLAQQSETIAVLDETLTVAKRKVKRGGIRVSTRTETREELAELALERSAVEITRVPIDRVVDAAPPVRTEGETTIMPVLEERLVVVRQLVLVEEVHIRRRIDHETQRTPVTLRRQHAEVLRFDANGQPIPDNRPV